MYNLPRFIDYESGAFAYTAHVHHGVFVQRTVSFRYVFVEISKEGERQVLLGFKLSRRKRRIGGNGQNFGIQVGVGLQVVAYFVEFGGANAGKRHREKQQHNVLTGVIAEGNGFAFGGEKREGGGCLPNF